MSSAGRESLPDGVDAVEIKVTLDSDRIEEGLVAFDLSRQRAHQPRRLLSASLDADLDDQQLDRVLGKGDRPVSRLFSTTQVDLLREWLVPLDGFDVLGPVQALKWDPASRGLEHKIAAEMWHVDDSLRFLELSIRVERDPEGAQQAFEALLRARHIQTPAQPETKTRMVLEHLSRHDGRR
jgi:hypothetical protein